MKYWRLFHSSPYLPNKPVVDCFYFKRWDYTTHAYIETFGVDFMGQLYGRLLNDLAFLDNFVSATLSLLYFLLANQAVYEKINEYKSYEFFM